MVSLRATALALAFVAGILLADRAEVSAGAAASAGIAGVLAIGTAWVIHRRKTEPGPGELLPALGGSVLVLILAGSLAVGFSDNALRKVSLVNAYLPKLDGQVVRVEGRITKDPEPAGRATRLILKVDSAHGRRLAERVVLRGYGGGLADLELGDRIAAEAKLRKLDPDNPYDSVWRRRGIVAQGVVSAETVEHLSGTTNPVLRATNHVRRRMELLASKSFNRTASGLVLGLTIGDERLIPDSLKDDFRDTSLSHLTAVSGTNVAIVVGAVIVLLKLLRVSKRAQILAGILTIAFFAVLTRWEPSVLRAAVMAALALGAFLFGRRYDPLHGVAVAFIALLAFDPNILWSIGFQLSFAATLGILAISPRLSSLFRRAPRTLAEALSVGVGAQAAVTPLLALYFGKLSIVSIPANLAAFPLVAPITVLGFAAAILATVWEPLARPVFEAAAFSARILAALAHAFASVPNAVLPVEFGVGHLLVAYLLVGGAALWLAGARRLARWTVVPAFCVWIFGLIPSGNSPPDGLRATFFDVGQGDAALVESPDGARVLVDGGPDPHFLARALQRRGIRRLDIVALSHFHLDHVNGIPAVLESLDARVLIDPGVPDPLENRLFQARRPDASSGGDRFVIGGLVIDVLSPPQELQELAARDTPDSGSGEEGSSLNNASLVLRVSWDGSCILFTGDLEEMGQQVLVDDHSASIRCSILKAPHHGSPRIDQEFVETVHADWVVISVGQNDYGHPSRTALSLFEQAGGEILRTDRLGDVVLELGSGGRVELRG